MLCLGKDVGGKRVDGPDLALSAICLLGKDLDGFSEGACWAYFWHISSNPE